MNMTIDTLIEKLKNDEKVPAYTSIYFTMHDLVEAEYQIDECSIFEFIHISTNTRIIVTYDPFNDNGRTDIWIILPNTDKLIWVAEDIDNKFVEATSIEGNINAFEISYLNERFPMVLKVDTIMFK